ncbi:MAG: tetratricopeptide repeat protein [Lactobacillaceae bacterium]|jgi:tetratricopeptide (TPR) repeat protein|nr:tetratricopeptide repeat protein [Lactobacillaceae bacterium]
MFENIIAKLGSYINNALMYIKNTLMDFFYESLGLSIEDLRFISLIVILITFSSLIIMTFIIYLRSLVSLVMGAKENAGEPALENKSDDKETKLLEAPEAKEEVREELRVKEPYGYDIGLILDMISRGVTEFKASQAIMFQTDKTQPEEQILQIVSAIKDFASFCKQGIFKNTLKENGPDERKALESIINGSITDAMTLLMDLIEKEVTRAAKLDNKKKRESIFKRLSDTCCLFGTLASLKDVKLALKSFEMAAELRPDNINAWSRLADMYFQTSQYQKAIDTYKMITDNANEEDKRQVANANIMMSKYHYERENSFEAQRLYDMGRPYYVDLSIGTDLNEREKEVLEFIKDNQIANLNKTIARLIEI